MFAVGLKPFEYAQHFLRRLTVSTIRHQFGIAEDRIKRRAQLVAHICEKMRFMHAPLPKLAALVLDFLEQPYILDGDHRLVGESLNQLDLLRGKWSRCGAP